MVKLDWALAEPIPWRAKALSEAGTVHLGADSAGPCGGGRPIETGTLPESPFQLFGHRPPPTRPRSPAARKRRGATPTSPVSTTTPRPTSSPSAPRTLVEAHAPGFRDRILHRVVQRPGDLQDADANLVHGARQRGHGAAVPTAGVPAGARPGQARDADREPLPRQRGRPSRAAACTASAVSWPRAQRWASTAGAAAAQARHVGGARPRPRAARVGTGRVAILVAG